MQISMCHMYMTNFAYDGPIFPLSPSYTSSHVFNNNNNNNNNDNNNNNSIDRTV